jgi:anion-transporting  ArsA/GET3 family ATPase
VTSSALPHAPRTPPRSLAPALLVMGKGGVGKTTVAASLAVLDAETHGAAVLVEFGDGESGRRALAGSHKHVTHVVIKPADALQRGAAPLFGSATVAKLALDNFAMRPLLRAAPAIRELAMLEAVRQVVAEHPGVRVVVDMPATGHGVAWLRVPKQGRDFLGAGPLFEMCDRVGRELLSPGRASIVVVTLPERLVIEETLELCEALAREVGLPADRVVVNRVPLPMAPGALADARSLAAGGGAIGEAARSLVHALEAREAAGAEATGALEALTLKEHAIWRVPLAPVDPSARDVARWLRGEGAA